LERVIKERYKKFSENFEKTNTAFERLARESIKEKKRKKKLTKDSGKPGVTSSSFSHSLLSQNTIFTIIHSCNTFPS
jgi:hypothetical protein